MSGSPNNFPSRQAGAFEAEACSVWLGRTRRPGAGFAGQEWLAIIRALHRFRLKAGFTQQTQPAGPGTKTTSNPAQAQRPYVALHVFALGIELPTHGEHLG